MYRILRIDIQALTVQCFRLLRGLCFPCASTRKGLIWIILPRRDTPVVNPVPHADCGFNVAASRGAVQAMHVQMRANLAAGGILTSAGDTPSLDSRSAADLPFADHVAQTANNSCRAHQPATASDCLNLSYQWAPHRSTESGYDSSGEFGRGSN